jgi:hypothetical protein
LNISFPDENKRDISDFKRYFTLKAPYFQNEYKTRHSAEASVKYFYSQKDEQEKACSLLQNFSQKTRTSWVLNVI